MAFLRFLYFISLLLFSLLPSGTISTFNVKYVLMGSLISAWLVLTLSRTVDISQLRRMLIPFLFILCWAMLGLFGGVPVSSIVSHATAILSVHLLICVYLDFAYYDNAWLRISNWLCISAFVISIVKVVLWMLVFTGQLSIEDVWEFVDVVFNFRFITLETAIGSRLHFPIDFLLPVALLISSLNRPRFLGRSKVMSLLFVAIILSSILISYARLLWGFSAIVLLVWMYTNTKRATLSMVIPGFVFPFLLLYPPVVDFLTLSFDFVSERFSGRHANTSDSVRAVMFVSLTEFFAMSPIIGSGLGSSAELVRFESLPWNYELQTYSWFGQFGVFGAALIYYYLFSIAGTSRRAHVMWPFLIGSWIVVNSINCFLLTSQGGVILISLVCASILMSQKLRPG